MIKNYRF